MKAVLTYFPVRARGEAPRLALRLANVEFEDKLVPLESWASLKESTSFGQLPMFKDDSVELCQSHAITYYVCKLHMMIPTNVVEEARALMICQCVEDIARSWGKNFSLPEAERPKFWEELRTTTVPALLAKLEGLVVSVGGDLYCVGNKLSIADVFVASQIEALLFSDAGWSPKSNPVPNSKLCPRLLKIHADLYSRSQVVEWANDARGRPGVPPFARAKQ